MLEAGEDECQTRVHSHDADVVSLPCQRSAARSTKELKTSKEVPHNAQKAPELARKPPGLPPHFHQCSDPTQAKREEEQFPFGSWLKPGSSCHAA